MVTINISFISSQKAREILNYLAGKEYIHSMNCNYDCSSNIDSTVTIKSSSNDVFSDLAGYFS